MKYKTLFLTIALLLAFPSFLLAGSAVLHWRSNSASDLAGYRIYYGTSSRSYGPYILVGKNVTSYTLNGLVDGKTYYFALTAVDTSGNESGYSVEVSKRIPGGIPTPTGVHVTPSLPSPQPEGRTVTFTASAGGGSGNYEYRFWVSGPGTGSQWVIVQNYSQKSSYTMNTTGYAGTNKVNVWVRNAGSSADWEAFARIFYTVEAEARTGTTTSPVSSARLSANLFSPQPEGRTVTFTASASGGSGKYEYKFWINGPGTGNQWIVAQDYSRASSYRMNTTGYAGTNKVSVWVRNLGSSADYEASARVFYTVKPSLYR